MNIVARWWLDEQPKEWVIENECILSCEPSDQPTQLILTPACHDIQVNGGGGSLLTDDPNGRVAIRNSLSGGIHLTDGAVCRFGRRGGRSGERGRRDQRANGHGKSGFLHGESPFLA